MAAAEMAAVAFCESEGLKSACYIRSPPPPPQSVADESKAGSTLFNYVTSLLLLSCWQAPPPLIHTGGQQRQTAVRLEETHREHTKHPHFC